MEELDGLAEQQGAKPPAAVRAGSQRHVEGDARQSGADSRTGQVFDEAIGYGFEDVCGAGAPQYGDIPCGEQK